MKQTWRWFGPSDAISIAEIRQTGATGIVSALHHVPPGQIWSIEEIETRKRQIEEPDGLPSGLTWDVVESVPVSEAIKSQSGPIKLHYDAYRESLQNLARCGISTICYNFMPVLDWTRTDLRHRMPNGGTAMRFDLIDFVIFDRFILQREGAEEDYSLAIAEAAEARFVDSSDTQRQALTQTIVAGLPGANDSWTLEEVRQQLDAYSGVTPECLRSNLIDFLTEVVPTAERLGVKLCCHPDDPPFALMGLPRVMSSQSDFATALSAVDSSASGATFCTGSLGVAKDFDPVAFIRELGPKIHFAHLRNTSRFGPDDGPRASFFEAEHLEGDTDMVATILALTDEERRRKREGRSDHQIPMRPDHGHALLGDSDRDTQPGYSLIGRMRGLAELRGVIAVIAGTADRKARLEQYISA